MKIFYLSVITFSFMLFSCNSEKGNSATENQSEINDDYKSILERYPDSSFDEQVKLFLQENHRIEPDENYSYEIIKGHFNNDQKEDAIITVNRYEYAVREASKSKNPEKRAEIGFMGYDNFFYFFDCSKNDFNSKPTLIQSTPIVPLKVSKLKLSSVDKSDLMVEYRIRNSARINIYNFSNDKSKIIFNWKKYDGFGTNKSIANVFKFSDSKNIFPKNIQIFKGEINNNKLKNLNFEKDQAIIKNQNTLLHTFYFDSKINKYITFKK